MAITRRHLLLGAGAVGAAAVLPGCTGSVRGTASSSAPASSQADTATVTRPSTSPARHAYGPDPNQFGELSLPGGTPRPGTVVVIHGGFWRAQYDLSYGRPLAADLVRRGYAVWNLEYRRVGQGGGWPGTFADVAAGIDKLADLGVDTDHVCAIGHSAGGQLAGWAVARQKLPPDAPGAQPKVITTAAVSQAGVLDMITAANDGVGGSAVPDVLGGSPVDVPGRYQRVDPIELLPVLAPVLCVHGRNDDVVPPAQSTAYVRAAHKTGSRATLHEVDGDHFTLIDPGSAAWQTVVDALPGLLKD